MKTLGWRGVFNTPKIQWYLESHGFKNIVLRLQRNTLRQYYGSIENHGIV
jgi:hypothetical protein